MEVSLNIKGHKETIKRFNRVRNRVINGTIAQLDGDVEKIIQQAQVEVPKDSGALHDTIRRDRTQVTKVRGIEIKIKAGGARAPYAIYVHEDLTMRHTSPTKAKFLEDPFKKSMSGVTGRLVRKINSELKKAGF